MLKEIYNTSYINKEEEFSLVIFNDQIKNQKKFKQYLNLVEESIENRKQNYLINIKNLDLEEKKELQVNEKLPHFIWNYENKLHTLRGLFI